MHESYFYKSCIRAELGRRMESIDQDFPGAMVSIRAWDELG